MTFGIQGGLSEPIDDASLPYNCLTHSLASEETLEHYIHSLVSVCTNPRLGYARVPQANFSYRVFKSPLLRGDDPVGKIRPYLLSRCFR